MNPLADKEQRQHNARGGKIGGKISPSNFKHDPKLASQAGKKSRARKWAVCQECGSKMSKNKMEAHFDKIHPGKPVNYV